MTEFQAKRIRHEHTQTNEAPPERVFPLLCPVREAEWVPGWEYGMIYSESGVAEEGCVFTTPNEAGPDSVWMVTEYDPAALRIAYAWVQPGLISTQLRIALRPAADGKTHAHIRYLYTGLSPEGNAALERFTAEWFGKKMRGWETAINHYLRTGELIRAAAWE
jgi:hypothetical protein